MDDILGRQDRNGSRGRKDRNGTTEAVEMVPMSMDPLKVGLRRSLYFVGRQLIDARSGRASLAPQEVTQHSAWSKQFTISRS